MGACMGTLVVGTEKPPHVDMDGWVAGEMNEWVHVCSGPVLLRNDFLGMGLKEQM